MNSLQDMVRFKLKMQSYFVVAVTIDAIIRSAYVACHKADIP